MASTLPLGRNRRKVANDELDALGRVVGWYFSVIYGHTEGPGTIPFYCDPSRVGHFAIPRDELAAGDEAALFRLFVALSMFQALRDVVIMKQQRALSCDAVRAIASLAALRKSIMRSGCPVLASAEVFDRRCDVAKSGRDVDCGRMPGLACHVKDATVTFNRMGDMGKSPTSAWLHLWQGKGIRGVLLDALRDESVPTKRAALIVKRVARVHRVGRKLATMFVSVLSTPGLAPGLTPWFPDVDGNELVVVDTNVARAVDALRPPCASKSYDARQHWVRDQAARIDVSRFHPDLPRYSPRLVQQALYLFCSKSNRVARADDCTADGQACDACVPQICPFGTAAC